MRGWMWLSCNEFGWLQATDTGYDSIFGNVVPLTYVLLNSGHSLLVLYSSYK